MYCTNPMCLYQLMRYSYAYPLHSF
uniref:Uncharacterized protein n=1 Tax=Arundo donax TaxID=35708 RepID=A0A0A9BA96_ARUDO